MFLIILIIMMMKEYVGINHIMKGTLCGMEGGDFSIACNGTLPHISCPLGYAQYGSFGLFFCHANEVKNDLMDGLFCGDGNENRFGPFFSKVQYPVVFFFAPRRRSGIFFGGVVFLGGGKKNSVVFFFSKMKILLGFFFPTPTKES